MTGSLQILQTARLSLRRVTEADDEFVLALMNEPAYLQHIGDRGIRTRQDAKSYILDKFATSYAKFGYGLYLAELTETRVAIGLCGFVKRDVLEVPDIGFAFLQEYRSRGFGFEAASAVLGYGFGTLGFRTVLGVTSPANTASIQLLEKLGLRYQKMMRIPPNNRDSRIYSTALTIVANSSLDPAGISRPFER